MENKMFRLKRIKFQIRRLIPILFLLVALVCLVLWKTENAYVVAVRGYATDIATPVIDAVGAPARWLDAIMEKIRKAVLIYQRNEELEQENEYLRGWRSVALQLGAEQQELKELLGYVDFPKSTSHTARIVVDQSGSFARGVVALAGHRNGVNVGTIALTSKGLFARVVYVNERTSQLMPMTDYLSRVPVWVGNNRVEALMVGDNSNHPKLTMVDHPELLKTGDVIMTSGYLGVYPTGLSVGIVGSINEDEISVDLFETGEKLNFVRLVDFGERNVLIQDNCACEEEK